MMAREIILLLKMKLFLFSAFVILMLVEVTLELRGRQEKC